VTEAPVARPIPQGTIGRQVTAAAPACVGNVAVGFDFLGHSIKGPEDRATVQIIPELTARIGAIRGAGMHIPHAAKRNTAGAALQSLRAALGLPFGFEVELDKGIPFAAGMGGSAASCVAALVAANSLLDKQVSLDMLYQCALDGESLASGARNGDNVGPILYGGLVIGTPERVVPVPVPPGLHCVLVHPHFQLCTLRARRVLNRGYTLAEIVRQTENLSLLLSGCFCNDLELLRAGLSDCLIEPRRAKLIPGFAAVKRAALDCGALGAGISGAGPSVFAWFTDATEAGRATPEMQLAFSRHGLANDAWISPVAGPAARIVDGPGVHGNGLPASR